MQSRLLIIVAFAAVLLSACGSSRRGSGLRDTGSPPADGGSEATPPMDGATPRSDGSTPPPDGATPDGTVPTDASRPPDTAPPPDCLTGSDCNDGVGCTEDSCRSNTCVNTPNHGLCSSGMTCELGVGCSGATCDESPCRLLSPQCGCPTGDGCYLTGETARSCLPAGTGVEGTACTRVEDCAPGGICAGFGVASCLRSCRSDADCPGTVNLCLLTAADGVTKLCTGTCDPIAQTGCPPGGGCSIGREMGGPRGVAYCSGVAGPGTQGSTCSGEDDCAAGYTCGGVCAKICRGGLSDCPSGTTCGALTESVVVGSTRYNLCS